MICSNWNILKSNPRLLNIFSQEPMVAYKRQPNLRDILTSNLVQYPPQTLEAKKDTPQSICTKSPAKCKYCQILLKTGEIQCTATGRTIKRYSPDKGYLTCKIKNVIYCITCKICKLQYIGQTSRSLSDRMYEHQYSVGNPKIKTPVSSHFELPNHKKTDMTFQVVEWINQDPKSSNEKRLRRENYWIWNFKTLDPYGINMMM